MQTTAEPTLRKFIDAEIALARAVFKTRGELRPMFVGQRADGERVMITVVFGDDDEKDAVARIVRHAFAEMDVVRYALLTEAWMLKLGKDVDINNLPRPSKSADRIEAVMVEGFEKGRPYSVCALMEIVREGKTVTLKDPEINDGPATGRFANLLDGSH